MPSCSRPEGVTACRPTEKAVAAVSKSSTCVWTRVKPTPPGSLRRRKSKWGLSLPNAKVTRSGPASAGASSLGSSPTGSLRKPGWMRNSRSRAAGAAGEEAVDGVGWATSSGGISGVRPGSRAGAGGSRAGASARPFAGPASTSDPTSRDRPTRPRPRRGRWLCVMFVRDGKGTLSAARPPVVARRLGITPYRRERGDTRAKLGNETRLRLARARPHQTPTPGGRPAPRRASILCVRPSPPPQVKRPPGRSPSGDVFAPLVRSLFTRSASVGSLAHLRATGGAWCRLAVFQRQQLLAVDGHIARRLDPQADLAAIDVHDRDADVVPDVNLLSQFPAQDQHLATLLRAKQWLACTCILLHARAPRCQAGDIFPPRGPSGGAE